MILERGNMWDVFGKTDVFLFTSNPIVNADGLAVMGRGMAKELADRHPEVRRDFGRLLYSWNYRGDRHKFCEFVGVYDGQHVGCFMVKQHWREPADKRMIQQSAASLEDWIQWRKDSDYPNSRFDLNFPGIGNGRLRREDILPIIERLPDTVHVWEYE